MHNITTIDLDTSVFMPDQDLNISDTIAQHTANTWQPQRSYSEKINDRFTQRYGEDWNHQGVDKVSNLYAY